MANTLITTRIVQPPAAPGQVRADIQGLRAIAVLLVLAFHLWPQQLSGGYVGVDVFLVISGFLITSHLLRRPPRTFSDLGDFWARRLRRLLPASLLVLTATVIAGCFILPASRLSDLGREGAAAVVYVVNWLLASNSVDYLAAQNVPSPVQHYWSLSVEEQFYFVWPILIVIASSLIARSRRKGDWVLVMTLVAFSAASLVSSIAWTTIAPASAYFVTPTRLWELGAGGILAAVLAALKSSTRPGFSYSERHWIRVTAAWIGLAAIAAAAFLFNGQTPFPGVAALIPVLGAILVIAARATGRWSPSRLLAWKPVQHTGDISYSLYLWHWPLIVLLPLALGLPLGVLLKLLILAVSVLLATLTKTYIEDPVRRSAWLTNRMRRTFALTAIAMLLALSACAIPLARVASIATAAAVNLQSAESENGKCFGAAALMNKGCDIRGIGVVPEPAVAIDDKSDAYTDDCFSFPPFDNVSRCVYGRDDAKTSIALVGNSHAGHLLPALQEYARQNDAQVTTFIGSRCRPSTLLIVFDTAAESEGCRDWGREVVSQTIGGDFDLIVASVGTTGELAGVQEDEFYEKALESYREPLTAWAEAGQRMLIIRDTPFPGTAVPDCVASHLTELAKCDGPRSVWLTPDPFIEAALQDNASTVETLDLTDKFCDETTCFSVIGGVLVYFDAQHLSATYSRTLAPVIGRAIDSALRGAP